MYGSDTPIELVVYTPRRRNTMDKIYILTFPPVIVPTCARIDDDNNNNNNTKDDGRKDSYASTIMPRIPVEKITLAEPRYCQ